MLTFVGSKLLPAYVCILNVYDVVDGLLLRCSGSGIGSVGSVWLIGSNTLTLDGRKLFRVRICFFVHVYDAVDGFLLRCTGSGIGSVSLFVSSTLALDGSKLFPV